MPREASGEGSTYRGEGDVQKVVERELRKAIAAIGAAPIDGESELD